MQHIPHSTFEDEARFIVTITDLIKKKELRKFKKWDASVKDEKAKLVRQKQGEKEAKEAEEMAKELGVWDEFFGSGKPSSKKGRGKGKQKVVEPEDVEMDEGGEEAEEKWRMEVQARFMRALHELDFMGFVKHTGRKADHVMKTIYDIPD